MQVLKVQPHTHLLQTVGLMKVSDCRGKQIQVLTVIALVMSLLNAGLLVDRLVLSRPLKN